MRSDIIEYKSHTVTAILDDAVELRDAYGDFLVGTVYGDVKDRWQDGSRIHTSRICERIGQTTFRTISGSVFDVRSWAPGSDGVAETAL